jgi:hypothetical protein
VRGQSIRCDVRAEILRRLELRYANSLARIAADTGLSLKTISKLNTELKTRGAPKTGLGR